MSKIALAPTTAETRLAMLASTIKDQTALVNILEADLKAQQKRLRQLNEVDMPELMDELGFEKIQLSSGETISVGDNYYMSISQANKPTVAQWLQDHGLGAHVGYKVEVEFNHADLETFHQLQTDLKSRFQTVGSSVSMHTGSVKSSVVKMLGTLFDAGEEVPKALGLSIVRSTKIK